MAERDLLDGVDDIPWRDLRHAYGAADDVPVLLRAVASGSDGADGAFSALFGSICHQGTIYPATPYAVAFLARIAAAGIGSAETLMLLGCIGQGDDERGPETPGSAREALAGQIDVLAPLLGDRDAEVRVRAVWALTQCRAPRRLVGLLGERWSAETDPTIRATVLKALSVLDPGSAAGIAAEVLASSGDGGLRLIAAAACVAAGVPWSDRLHDAATAWMADGDVLPGFWWDDADPFGELVMAVAGHGNPGAAVRLVVAGLACPVAGAVRTRAVDCADRLTLAYRSAARALAGPLAGVAGDDDAGLRAIGLLRTFADIAAAARQLAAVADVRGPDRRADAALACLIELGDPRAARLLARDLRHRPYAVHAVAYPLPWLPPPSLPFDADLLEAVREQLRVGAIDPAPLLALLRAWGPAAQPAIPEVLALQPRQALGAGLTLASVGSAIPAAVRALRLAVTAGTMWQRLTAASTLRSLTGDDGPLLAVIEYGLRQPSYSAREQAAKAARALGTTSRSLVPALTTALHAIADSGTTGTSARIQIALSLWHHTRDPAPAIGVLADGLSQDRRWWDQQAGISAADAAAVMGPAAQPLIPVLLPLLDNPTQCPAAVQALWRIDPERHAGIDRAMAAGRLVTAISDAADASAQGRAVETLSEIGLAHLTSPAIRRLRRLAEQDQRIIRSGIAEHVIRQDEKLRAAIRQLLKQPG